MSVAGRLYSGNQEDYRSVSSIISIVLHARALSEDYCPGGYACWTAMLKTASFVVELQRLDHLTSIYAAVYSMNEAFASATAAQAA